jgi:hypothetical protein
LRGSISFFIHCRAPWTSDQPVARSRAKTVRTLDRAATVTDYWSNWTSEIFLLGSSVLRHFERTISVLERNVTAYRYSKRDNCSVLLLQNSLSLFNNFFSYTGLTRRSVTPTITSHELRALGRKLQRQCRSLVFICSANHFCYWPDSLSLLNTYSKRPWRPIGLWDVEAPTFSRKSGQRWQWDQPYATAALYPPRRFLVLISVRGSIYFRAIMRLEVLGQMKIYSNVFGNQTHDLPACSIAPHPNTLPRSPFVFRVPLRVYWQPNA